MIDRVVVINDICEAKGGATALALASALGLRARGIPVTVLTGDHGDNAALAAADIAVVGLGGERMGGTSKARAFASGLYNPAARRMVARWIAQHDTPRTVYHVHGWAQILSPSVFAALRAVRARTVLHAHDFFLACPNGSFSFLRTGAVCPLTPLSLACIGANCDRRAYVHKLWRVARQEVLRICGDPAEAPVILAIHRAMAPFLMRAGIPAEAIDALPNPVRPYSDTRIAAERNAGIVFVGRLEATKGPDLAARAARAAGVAMTFVGDGELRATLQAEYPEMTFCGRLEPSAIAVVAARARALVMPSRYPEPYGLVAAEALWSGLPVIVNDTAFLAGDITAAQAGFAVDPRDTTAFAAALRTIADDDLLVERMSIAAFEATRAIGLSSDAWLDRLVATYRTRLASVPVAMAA